MEGNYLEGFKVGCHDCHIQTGNYRSRSLAIAKWNTRAPSKDRELLIELSLPNISFEKLIETAYTSNALFYGEAIVMLNQHIEITESNTKEAGEALIAFKIRAHLKENP